MVPKMHSTPFLHTFLHLVVLLVTVPQVARADLSQAHRRSLRHSQLRHVRLQQRDLPPGWTSLGCYTDDVAARTLTSAEYTNATDMTVEKCVNFCKDQYFIYAGVEYGEECYCGNEISNGSEPTSAGNCSMVCSGDSYESCGGPNRLNLYNFNFTATKARDGPTVIARDAPTVQTTNLPGNWQYSRCLAEPDSAHVFPYKITLAQNNNAQNCLSQCAAFGYPAAGMESGNECWCGDVADITNNKGTTAPETDCSMACSGDPSRLCGGNQRLQLYLWNGNLFTWDTPANTGRFEYLVPGLAPTWLATLGINGKVSFFMKGPSPDYDNSTGAASRQGRRVLNVGGYSDTSTFGVRLYAPDGSPGVNSVNDWEEDPNTLKLQSGRWYPTALVMANGSVLVVGGEIGPNAPANPTLEILPRIPGGNTQVFLDWLQRTDPNNLYPFLHVLPSGLIFVGYYNEARLLDPVTFATVKILPNIPGSVSSAAAGRTYGMSGASVLLPQRAPYTDPIAVLICGGSDSKNGLDNCVSIQPESPNPTWVIERMPSKRVMPCMVALPDGTFMIMNGAHNGVAGFFGLASDPNLSALLYDPSKPVNSRISVLASTTIARMYHSEAMLLPDGRVLISGSDPRTPGLPEELRVEVFIPPYLSDGPKQPEVTIPNKDWTYGGQFQINVQLFQGQTDGMRVSLVAATSSTHGNMMGGRTIFPAFSCLGNVCTVTAPPNANVSPPGWHQLFILDGPTPSHGVFVRIGGDPAQLGNWPAMPGFNPPGV
ncbi:copper radical oxidase [Lactifluus subvellereus]|nr:copper radical oxidase [Lactifluus subvellereus]